MRKRKPLVVVFNVHGATRRVDRWAGSLCGKRLRSEGSGESQRGWGNVEFDFVIALGLSARVFHTLVQSCSATTGETEREARLEGSSPCVCGLLCVLILPDMRDTYSMCGLLCVLILPDMGGTYCMDCLCQENEQHAGEREKKKPTLKKTSMTI